MACLLVCISIGACASEIKNITFTKDVGLFSRYSIDVARGLCRMRVLHVKAGQAGLNRNRVFALLWV